MYKRSKEQGTPSHVRYQQQSTKGKYSGEDLLYTPPHIQNRLPGPGQARLHSHRTPDRSKSEPVELQTLHPAQTIFNPVAIAQAYANRCQQLQRVIDQIKQKEEELPQLRSDLTAKQQQHTELSTKLKNLQVRGGWSSRRFDVEIERYNFRIVDLEAQLETDRNDQALKQALEEATIQKLIRSLTTVERNLNNDVKNPSRQASPASTSRSTKSQRLSSPKESTLGLSSSRVAIANSKKLIQLQDAIERKSLTLREARMVRQKTEYEINAMKLSNNLKKDSKDIAKAQERISTMTDTDSPRHSLRLSLPFSTKVISTESRDDLAFKISMLQTRIQTDRTINETQYQAVLKDINASTSRHQSKIELVLRTRPPSLTSQGKEATISKRRELAQLRQQEQTIMKEADIARSIGDQLRNELEQVTKLNQMSSSLKSQEEQKQLADSQNKVEMCREQLEFINQSCKTLEAELVKLRNEISSISNELTDMTCRKLAQEESKIRVDILKSEVNRLRRENDREAAAINERSQTEKSMKSYEKVFGRSPQRSRIEQPSSPLSQEQEEQCEKLQQSNNYLQVNLSQLNLKLKEYEYLVKLQVQSEIDEWRAIIETQESHLKSLQEPFERRLSCSSPTLMKDLQPIAETVEEQFQTEPEFVRSEASLSQHLETEVFSDQNSCTKKVGCYLVVILQVILLLWMMWGWQTRPQLPIKPHRKKRIH